jgi:hypothetical protein
MKTCRELHPISLGLAFGIVAAIAAFLTGILDWSAGYGREFVRVMGSVDVGYAPSLRGSLAGAVWAFAESFIGGVLVAWFYNYFCHKFCQKYEQTLEVKPKQE